MTFTIVRLPSAASTNDEVLELARRGAAAGTVVIADAQTAGRGTKGRLWHSERGQGLYVSVLLKPPLESLSLLPLAVGLAARGAAEKSAGVAARLKWPNDLVWDGRKLGGVLCESRFRGGELEYAVAGIGLNVGQEPADFPDHLRDRAVSLRMAAGRPVAREAVCAALLTELSVWLDQLTGESGPSVAEAFAAFSVPAPGGEIVIDAGDGPAAVRYAGIDRDGALLVLTRSGPRRYLSAEIVRVF